MNINEEKNVSLLRPFDLEAAKRGAPIYDLFGGKVVFFGWTRCPQSSG